MSFENIPSPEAEEYITDEEAVEILRTEPEGIASEKFQRFLDQGESEADLADTSLANLEWAFRLAVICHKAGLNKEYEVQDLEELFDAAYNEEGDLAKRINKIIEEIKEENKSDED